MRQRDLAPAQGSILIALEMYFESRVKPVPAARVDARTAQRDASNFERRFRKFAQNKFEFAKNKAYFQGAVLDMSFCLAAPGLRRQLSAHHYALFIKGRGQEQADPLQDVHGLAFVRCGAVETRTAKISHVERLVTLMHKVMTILNNSPRPPLAPLLDRRANNLDESAQCLALVCDAMFPGGAPTLEHLTRGLMSALVGAVGRQ
jgi:hypothetical protein